MKDPMRKRYFYLMFAGFGAISLSLVLFFIIYRLQGIGEALESLSAILAPFLYGGVIAYLLRPICNSEYIHKAVVFVVAVFFIIHFLIL